MAEHTTQLPARLALARRLPPHLRAAALDAALHAADDDELCPIAVELTELALPGARHPAIAIEALTALIRAWDRLPPDARQTARAAGRRRWGAAAARLEAPTDHARPICRLVEDTADPTLFDALGALLETREPELAARAGPALFAYVRRLRPELTQDAVADDIEGPPPEPMELPPDPDPDPPQLCAALAELAWRYADHRSRWSLIAVLLITPHLDRIDAGDGADRLRRLIGQPTHPAGSALRGVLRRARSPAMRAAAWRLLADPAISGPALERFAVARGPREHEVVLELAHLLLRPQRRQRLGLIDLRARPDKRRQRARDAATAWKLPGEAPLPDAAAQRHLSATARRGLPRLCEAISMDEPARELTLGRLLADTDPIARHAAMRASRGAGALDYCFDPHERVARSAMLRTSNAGQPWPEHAADSEAARGRADMLDRLTRSPHAPVRTAARDEAARTNPWDPREPASRILARARLRSRGAEAFLAELRRRILAGPVASRLDAIRLAALTRCVERVSPEVIAAARAPSGLQHTDAARVSATAAIALSHDPSPDATRALTFCLSHADDRVRANAVEALARRSRRALDLASECPTTYAVLIELKSDENNRVRANALRGLLDRGAPGGRVYEPAAVSAAGNMLEDERPAHRISGLWLIERLGSRSAGAALGDSAATMGARARRLADQSESDHERRWADRAQHRLVSSTRAAWSGSAAQVLDGQEAAADEPGPRNAQGATGAPPPADHLPGNPANTPGDNPGDAHADSGTQPDARDTGAAGPPPAGHRAQRIRHAPRTRSAPREDHRED